jgi:Immunity protein 27
MKEHPLEGEAAIRYAETKLKKVRSDPEKWEVEYVDEATGEKWLLDYPNSEEHGGGVPRLRRIR